MGLLVDAFHKGGPFMWPILLIAICGFAGPVVLAGLAGAGKRVPAVLWWLAPIGALLVGALGTVQGLLMTVEAVQHASLETKSTLAHAGYSTSLFTLISGCIVASGLLTMGAVLGAVGYFVGGSREPGPASPGVPALIGVGALLGGLALIGLSLSQDASTLVRLTAIAALAGGLSLALASVRRGDNDADDRRLADGRLAIAGCVLGATALAGVAAWIGGEILVHEAFAHASGETRLPLVELGLKMRAAAAAVGFGAIGLTALLTAFSCLPVGKRLANTWTLVNTGLIGLIILAGGGAVMGVHAAAQPALMHMTQVQVLGLRDVVSGLPATSAHIPLGQGGLYTRPLVQDGDGWQLYQGAPVTLPREPGDSTVIAVSGATSARSLAELQWFDSYGRLDIVTVSPLVPEHADNTWLESFSYGFLNMIWEGPGADINEMDLLERVVVRDVDGRILLSRPGGDEATVDDLASAEALLEATLSGDASVRVAAFVPGDRWSVSELTALCAVAKAHEPARSCVLSGL